MTSWDRAGSYLPRETSRGDHRRRTVRVRGHRYPRGHIGQGDVPAESLSRGVTVLTTGQLADAPAHDALGGSDHSRLTSSATGTPLRNLFTSSSGSNSTPIGFWSNAVECIQAWPSSAVAKLSICSSMRLPSGSR